MNYKKVFHILKRPKEIPTKINYRYPSLLKWMRDENFLKFWYRYNFGRSLNLQKPETFNEKLQWLKLYDHRTEYITMVDKYEAKNFVARKIGKDYIIPTLGVWKRFEDIDIDALPEQFVLKCTHDSGGLVICTDKAKFDPVEAKRKIERSQKRNFYWVGREWPYKDVTPRIIAEQYMVDESGVELKDYKLMCFDGKVKCTFTCSNRKGVEGLYVKIYDRDWNPLPFERHYHRSPTEIKKPECYDGMVQLAEKLAQGIPFVRVDFYQIDGKPYFGEMTFYPGSGFEKFTPDIWDKTLGDWLKF